MDKRHAYYLLAAILVGLLARAPGIFWGADFPFGWHGHHPDEYTHLVNAEMIINPGVEPRWKPHPYPKGLAAHVAVPMLVERKLAGSYEIPSPGTIITVGRLVSVLYGTAMIPVVFLLARRLFRDPRVAVLTAWMTALGGLLVTQSHFFVSDVPAICCLFLALYLLARDLQHPESGRFPSPFLSWAAFASGAAVGLKLSLAGLPSLGLVALGRRPRVLRAADAGIYLLAGFLVVNFATYTPYDVMNTLAGGLGDPTYHFSRLRSALLYAIELPSIMSLPILVLALAGAVGLARKALAVRESGRRRLLALVVLLPMSLSVVLMLKPSHFPRHVLPLLPWFFMAAAWSVTRIMDWLGSRGRSPAWITIPLFAYLALFVIDGERVFLQEPRDRAARWVEENVARDETIYWRRHAWIAGYDHAVFPDARPDVMIMEMLNANHYLSGLGWKNSYPTDCGGIFDCPSQEWVDEHQALFRGTAGYREVARFDEGYFMPEYVVTDGLLGNRSRNYVSEVVIFRKERQAP